MREDVQYRSKDQKGDRNMNKEKILIVEDDAVLAMHLSYQLKKFG